MKTNLLDKKLLILGANIETIPLIQTAQKMGVFTVVTDNNPYAPAKKYADKSCDVNGLDVDGLVELAKQEKIDGVMVGVADRLIVPYQEVCEALNLPCYGTKEQCEIFTDKRKFNDICNQYDIPIIPEFKISKDPAIEELNKIKFPVFVKPVDGNSGKGMSICYSAEEIKPAIDKALMFSKSQRFIVDEYMDCDNIFVYYTFQNREIHLSAIADRYTTNEQGNVSKVCLGGVYPSKYIDLYLETLHDKMCLLFKSLNVQNGVLMISAFVKEGKIHLYDPGFRLQGEAPNFLIEAANGFDQKEMLVNFALTGQMGIENLDMINKPDFNEKYAASVWFLLKEGVISEISGLDELRNDKQIVYVQQRFKINDVISKDMVGTEAQVLSRVYVVCNSKEELKLKIKEIQNSVKVFDEKGNSMLLNGYTF